MLHQPVIGYDRGGILKDERMSEKDVLAMRFCPQFCMYVFTVTYGEMVSWALLMLQNVAMAPLPGSSSSPLHCLVSATWLARGCKWGLLAERHDLRNSKTA